MIWQDIVLSIGSILFAAALLPSVRSKDKPDGITSGITGTILAIYVPTFITLGLITAAITTGVTAGIWFVLLYQVRRRKNDRIY